MFDAIKGQTGALYVLENALMSANADQIIVLALDAKLPTTFTTGISARAGALMSYGPNIPALFRHAADYVDKILHGTKPGELPVEQPTQFDFVINLKTAKALGLTVPHNLLVLAEEVIDEAANVAYWAEASVRCIAAIRPESGVKPTYGQRSTDLFDPLRTSAPVAILQRGELLSNLAA